jgi:eukaryotic-like serine/threonine-protein kinase
MFEVTSRPMPCPPEWELVAYGEGRLPAERATAIALHLPQCVECQKRVSALGRAVTTGSSPTVLAADSTPTGAPLLSVKPGMVLGGKYRVERMLGQGGMGVVVEATHVGLMQRVAIKFLRGETKAIAGALDRFVREARAAAGIRSEHVVRVFDTGVFESGEPYIVMELLDGEDLRTRLMRHGVLPPMEVASFAIEACEALSQAHALGIVHRDLKPANLFAAARADGSPHLKVLDFGISKVYGDGGAQTTANVALGSPLYMSPEQIQTPRDVDARTDVWSLGVVLYECLAGRPPFEGEGLVGLATSIVSTAPRPLPSSVPTELAAIVRKCLEKSRQLRFPSATDLAVALRPFANEGARVVADRIARAIPRSRSTPPSSSRDAPISGFEATMSPSVARSGSLSTKTMSRRVEIAVSLGLLAFVGGGALLVWSLRTKSVAAAHLKSVPPAVTTVVEPPPSASASTLAPLVTAEPSASFAPRVVHNSARPSHTATAPGAVVTAAPTPTVTATADPADLNGALRERK